MSPSPTRAQSVKKKKSRVLADLMGLIPLMQKDMN